MTRVLTVPGWGGSGAQHWQTLWERLDGQITRVQQRDWENPSLDEWLPSLERAVDAAGGPVVLAAHSLGCHLVSRLLAAPNVVAALLVAPPDLEARSDELPTSTRGFVEIRSRLPFPSIVVASSDDPWSTLERSRGLATRWGSRFVDVGAHGHLNSDSALGTWPTGRALLEDLRALAPFELDPRLAGDSTLVGESDLSLLLLFDDARYPWCVLVPKRPAISELFQLTETDRTALTADSAILSSAMNELFTPDKLNVGALGNVVRQLHLHHVARHLDDPAWPGPVWGHSPRVPRDARVREELLARLRSHPALHSRFR